MKKLIPYLFRMVGFVSPKLAAKMAVRLFLYPRRLKRADEEMAFLATGKEVNFASQRKARSWGQGPVVWLLHGWESRGSTYYKLIPMLQEKGFQVVAWDGPAHGDSPGKRTHVPDYAHALYADMQEAHFAQPHAILGHSFGGAALAALSKIFSLPKRLVIVSAPTRIDRLFNGFARMIRLNETAKQLFFSQVETEAGYSLLAGSLVSTDLSLKSKVLVIHDENDDVIPYSDFTALQAAWSEGEFVSTRGLGHRLTIKDEQILTTISEFIANTG